MVDGSRSRSRASGATPGRLASRHDVQVAAVT
jgi:hypothetical protein